MFFKQPNIGDHHRPINRLDHVVNGEQSHLYSGERLHFNAGAAVALGLGPTVHCCAGLIDGEIDGDASERNRVAQRYQIGGALGPLNGRDSCNAQHIALGRRPLANARKRSGLHPDGARGDGDATGDGFVCDVDHMRLAGGVEVSKHGGSAKRHWGYDIRMSLHALRRLRSWACAGFASLALLLPLGDPLHAQPAELPRLGDAGGDQLSPIAERRLGDSIIREIRRARALLDDPELVDYLNRLAARLAAQPIASGFTFELFAVEDRSINAFALPGGYIGIHTGLVASSQAESELASVLAHELGHVTQRHIARMLATQQQSSTMLVASIAAALLAARSNPQAAAGLVSLGSTLQMQQVLGYSRDAEREADRVGVEMLQQAGFDPQGMVDFFGRLQAASRLSETALPAYLRTHPLTGERMSDIQNRVMALRYRQHADSLEFSMLRARYRALADRTTDGVQRARQVMTRQIDDGAVSPMVGHYALAAGALVGGELARARASVGSAREASSGKSHPYIEHLAALIELEAGEARAALTITERAIERFGPTRALARARIRALSALGQWSAAVEASAQALESAPNDTELWELLARAQFARGNDAPAHVAMAELHAVNGAWVAAIDQLQAAQRSRQLDFYDSSRVDARLREIRALFFQEREDRRTGR